MSGRSVSMHVLTCDNGCGAEIKSTDYSVSGLIALRMAAQKEGWNYVIASVPTPDVGYQRAHVKRPWDFCPSCGIPATVQTTFDPGGFGRSTIQATVLLGSALLNPGTAMGDA